MNFSIEFYQTYSSSLVSVLTHSFLRRFGTFFVRNLLYTSWFSLNISGNDLQPRRRRSPAFAGRAGRFPYFGRFYAFCRFPGWADSLYLEDFSGSGGFSAGDSCWLFAALSSSLLSSCRSCWGRSLALVGSPCCCWLRST